MNPPASRKQLLIAESELNRVQLAHELQTMMDEVRALTNQARTIRSLATGAASLVGSLASFQRKKSAPVAEQTSWWRTAMKGAQLAGALWSEFGPQRRGGDDGG